MGRWPPWFFVSVADKGVSVTVSGLESTLAEWFVSVDSEGDGCLGGCGGCRRNKATGRPGLGLEFEFWDLLLKELPLRGSGQAEATNRNAPAGGGAQ